MAKRKINAVVIQNGPTTPGGGHRQAGPDRNVPPERDGAVQDDRIVLPGPDGAAVIGDKGDRQSER
jgi:hypothetical protein